MKRASTAFLFALFTAFVVALLVPKEAFAAAQAVQRFALVIGNNRPDGANGETLRYADDDAVATHVLLTDAGVQSLLFVTPDEETRALHPGLAIAGPAVWSEIERGFATLVARINGLREKGVRTELLFFYSGHGDVEDGEGFVVLSGHRLTRSMLFSLLSRSPASYNHVFVDACKSYFLVFDRGVGGHRTPYAGTWVESVPARLGNTGFVLSTSSDRESHEWERYQGGVLSHELRSGLRGAADANADGVISYAELGAFLSTANRAIQNPRFKPDFTVRAPGQDLDRTILSYPTSRASLNFKAGNWGHFYVENARGTRLLDAHPAPSSTLRLYLPSERPLFVRQSDERAEYVLATDGPVAISGLSPATPEIAQRGALSLAFQFMFSAPFGPADVAQFRAAPVPPPHQPADEAPARASSRRTVATVAGVTAVTALAAGVTFSALALNASLGQANASHRDLTQSNQQIVTFNRASVPCYAVGLAAGLTWAWARFWPESQVTFTAPTAAASGKSFGLGVERSF